MIITISGKPGSGKSSVAKEVAKKLNLEHHSMGDFQREIAKEKNISLTELAKIEEQDKSFDLEVDKKQEQLGKKEDNFIIDSRIGFYFIPNSVKVFLDVDFDVGAERIFKQGRNDERFSTIEKTKEEIKKRADSEKKRYMEYYGLDHYDMENYDVVIDTSDKNIKEVVEEVIGKVKEKAK